MSEYLTDFIEHQVAALESVGVDGQQAINAGADAQGVAVPGDEAAILLVEVAAIVNATAIAQVAQEADAMACEQGFGLIGNQAVDQVGFACPFGGGQGDDAGIGDGLGEEDSEIVGFEFEGRRQCQPVIQGLPELPFFKGQRFFDGLMEGIEAVVGD